MKKEVLSAGLLVCTTLTSFAWGRLGHQTIATCATSKLNPAALAAVQNILASSSVPEITTPENAATWPDDIKPGHSLSGKTASRAFNTKFKGNNNWHFDDYPLEGTYTLTGPFSKNTDVVHEINNCIDALEHKAGAPDMGDVQALAFLIHLVGDLHQPLHVGCGYYKSTDAQNHMELVRSPAEATGLPHDVGGNNLVWGASGPHQPEFHAFWDDDMVFANGTTSKVLGKKIAANWNKVHLATRPADYHHWAEAWATDSIKLSNDVYVDATGLEGVTKTDTKHNNEKVVVIEIDLDTQNYKDLHAGQALDQLTKASRDLADLLNQIHWPTEIAGGNDNHHHRTHPAAQPTEPLAVK